MWIRPCILTGHHHGTKILFPLVPAVFFEGRRKLFKGLFIDSGDWDWEESPVLPLDLNSDRYADPGLSDSVLERLFREWESRYDVQERHWTTAEPPFKALYIGKMAEGIEGRKKWLRKEETKGAYVFVTRNDRNRLTL